MGNSQLNIQKTVGDQEITTTANGMKTNPTSTDKCVDLFFSIGAMRGAKPQTLIKIFEPAFEENPLLATKILHWVRDARGGAGERQIFRDIISHLAVISPNVVRKNLNLILEYGRGDDLLVLLDTELKEDALEIIKTELLKGNGLVAKWMDRKGKYANEVRRYLKCTPKEYRKLVVGLTNVVETAMCSGDWDSIDYSKIPSLAASRYQKAFHKNDGERYREYIEELVKGNTKVNAGAVYPYDIIKSINMGGDITVSSKQWESLPNYMEGCDENVLPVVDVSGSMTCPAGDNNNLSCMDVAISLGMYISERNESIFKDAFITFSANPQLQFLKGSLSERLQQLRRADWGYNTNIQKVFDLILNQAVEHNISQDDMPTKIIILSDMEFDTATKSQGSGYGSRGGDVPKWTPSLMEIVKEGYGKHGYKLPSIVFWNLNGRSVNGNKNNYPVQSHETDTALVSGFSPSLMKSILSTENLTPYNIMMETVSSERYEPVTI
jgi:hypothetical protein